jgi:hypothetical protein
MPEIIKVTSKGLCMKIFKLLIIVCAFTANMAFADAVKITVNEESAIIQNNAVLINVNLSSGHYSGTDLSDHTVMFRDAVFLLDAGITRQWEKPNTAYVAENIGKVRDDLGNGNILRVWHKPDPSSYDPQYFLDITLYEDQSYTVLGWGAKNPFGYDVRICKAELLFGGKIFENQIPIQEKVLRGGAGAEQNFVKNTWKIDAHNSAMLTYIDQKCNDRRTIVTGGLQYAEFMRHVAFQQGIRTYQHKGSYEFENPEYIFKGDEKQMTLTVRDPQGKRIPPGKTWKSKDTFYLDFTTRDPFLSLEQYGNAMAAVNNANPNKYDFPTLCGWAVGALGEGTKLNHSPGLVEQMDLAFKSGVLDYTPVAIRLEPDYYCYGNNGNTQQGWWDDEHWAAYGSLKPPYETFNKFSKAVKERGGIMFTYFQASLPSNDFAMTHPDWMLNNDISRLHLDHAHHRPPIRYDYSDPGFQKYLLTMWKRLRNDGIEGIKFDYPETAWATYGGFEDKSYTTVSAYRKLYQLCRKGLGESAYIHERIIGNPTHEKIPRTDVCAGIVDLQRVWSDASHYEPEMASRMGLRWYKQGKVFRYYPDSKSLIQKGKNKIPLSVVERRTILTMVGLLSGRLELASSFGRMAPEIIHDLTRIFPVLPNGKAFRPVDMLLNKQHPETYVYDVTDDWKQIILVNNDVEKKLLLEVPASGDQSATGSIGFKTDKEYEVFDFWNQQYAGSIKGSDKLVVELKPSEARVYSVREKKNYPRIIGTDRHIMCGMFEIKNEKWSTRKKCLSFTGDFVIGEQTKVTISVPGTWQADEIRIKGAHAELIDDAGIITVLIDPEGAGNSDVDVSLYFAD